MDRNERTNARRRARKAVARADVNAQIELVYQKPIEQWDDEELTRGRPRGPDGTFRGKRPSWLTPAIQAERQRRLRQLMADDLHTFAADALKVIHAVMIDPATVPRDRLDAAKYLTDQVLGKAKVSVDVHDSSPLESLLAEILVNPDGEPSHQVIEGGVVDPSDAEDVESLRELE